MAINRKSRRSPEAEDYYEDDEKVTRRPADEDEDEERPRKRRSSRRDDDDEDEDEAPRRKSRRRSSDDDDDEDEAEAPRKRRSSRRDDDDEAEAPRKRRSSRRDDDDEDEDEAPRRKSRRRSSDDDDDDDEDEAPRRKSRRRSSDDDDDEDEAPRRKSRRRDEPEDEDDEDDADDRSSLIQSGWGAAKKNMAASSEFTNDFRFDEEPQVVKFLSTEPMSYQQHWIERKGKRSFVCLGPKCPLCKAGDNPSPKYAWPVLNFGMEASGDQPVTQLLVCGTKLAKQLEKQDGDKRNGPLDKLYWALSKTGKQQSTSYVLEPVKERDLADDWEIDPDEAADAVDNAKVPGEEAINLTSRDDLVEIARELR